MPNFSHEVFVKSIHIDIACDSEKLTPVTDDILKAKLERKFDEIFESVNEAESLGPVGANVFESGGEMLDHVFKLFFSDESGAD